MIFRSFRLFLAAVLASLVLFGCGSGSSAPAPTGLKVVPGETTVTVSWDMTPGVEYLFFFGPTSYAPSSVESMSAWIGLPYGGTQIKATSPLVVASLVDGLSYSFSVNGRIDGGPGGPGATPKVATPRLAGASWAAGPATAGSTSLRCVTYGTGFVAAGDGGALYGSADGVTWDPLKYVTTTNLHGCSYSGNYQVVGDGGLILTSSDVITWTQQTSGTTENLYAITSNYSNLFVAVGANGTIITSPDGITWTARNSTTGPHLYAVNYSSANSGIWIAVGAAGTILKSVDGITWTTVASGTTADLRSVAFGASSTTGTGTFVAVGAAGTALTSLTGETWAAVATPITSSDLNAIRYGTQYVAVGAGGQSFVSTDSVTWAPSSTPGTTSDLYAVVRGSLMYSAVGAAGTNILAK